MMRWQLNAHLPQGKPGSQGVCRLVVDQTLVFFMTLLSSLRHCDVGVLPPLFEVMPALERVVRAEAALCQDLLHDPICLPGGVFTARVEKDIGAVSAHRDAVAEPALHVVLHLMLTQRLNRLPGIALIMKRYRHSPVVVCHGETLQFTLAVLAVR